MNDNTWFGRRNCYFGDFHNHCGISYAHGSLSDAIKNGLLQLDFLSVTGHAAWPDMEERSMSGEVRDYHIQGFEKLRRNREYYAEELEKVNRKGEFVTFGSYELHSFRYGDYTVLQKSPSAGQTLPPDGDKMESFIQSASAERDGFMLVPHHIGYKRGFRGLSWDDFNPQASPLVEIVSMHGCAESTDSPFPYLHTMGPLDDGNTMQAGLARGLLFGITGSTDHHSAHPGSYGYGKTALWAEELSRDALWGALLQRRCYAVSGDRIVCSFSVNGEPMGGIAEEGPGARRISLSVRGGGSLSRVEILKNNKVWHQKNYIHTDESASGDDVITGKVLIEMGWGEKKKPCLWDVEIGFEELECRDVEPRFRGVDVVDPLDETGDIFSFSDIRQKGGEIHLHTMTSGNATSTTSQTQALSLELRGCPGGILRVKAGSTEHRITLGELLETGKAFYMSGFLSPAMKVHRFIPERGYTDNLDLVDPEKGKGDFYYARIFQENGQAAWISPVRMQ
jgi:hypothetical protein